MQKSIFTIVLTVMIVPSTILMTQESLANDVVRPEEIRSLRQVVYDKKTYSELEDLWKAYYDEYPSEYAYANWMYAARYASDKEYSRLLAKGLEKYPSNPTLLYLKAIESHGRTDDIEGLKYLEKAIAIDPGFVDPWFLLVTHYMESGDTDRLDGALRHILESGIITDEIMDYNYNMLAGLDENAILITNGDNDTYPGWILTRILGVRSDVDIVNRSLLNTEWYPLYVITDGLPRFIDKSELDDLRSSILERLKEEKTELSPGGPFGDTLILKIVESAERAGRPVYFSKTLFHSPQLKEITDKGEDLGLAILVTPSKLPYADQLRKTYKRWVDDFRTAGLESWRLRNAPETDAGRMLITNYCSAIKSNLGALKSEAPGIRQGLFRWYLKYIERAIPEEMRSEIANVWCLYAGDIKEISDWGKQQGLKCAGSMER